MNKGDTMRVLDLWKNNTRPTLSFELFPARSEKGAEKLERVIDELAGLNPDFVSVTARVMPYPFDAASGSTSSTQVPDILSTSIP